MRVFLSLVTVVIVASAAGAQAPVPSGRAPQFGLATAVEKDGQVIVEIFELRETVRMKAPNGFDVFIEQRNWLSLKAGTLGKDIRAYRPDGKTASAKEVLAALAKPRGVFYFIGYDKAKAIQPDPFFLGLLKEGSVALAFDRPMGLGVQP